MRLVSAMMIASLLSTSGCSLALAPAIGAGTGIAIGIGRNHGNLRAGVAVPAILGGLVGAAVDAYVIFLVERSWGSHHGSDASLRGAP